MNKKRRFYTVMFVYVTVTWAYMGIPVACNWHSADCKANGDTLVVVVLVVVGGGGGWISWAIVSNSL